MKHTLLAGLCLCLVATAEASTIFVAPTKSKTATPTAPYDTPETAFKDLILAMNYAKDGDELKLLEGQHNVTDFVYVAKSVHIIGQGSDFDKTVIYSDHSVRGGNGPSSKPEKTGVMKLMNGGAVVENVKITKGIIRTTDTGTSAGTGYGGGVDITGTGGTLLNCHITDNEASGSYQSAGGVALRSQGAKVIRCVLDNNRGTGNGNSGDTRGLGGNIYMEGGLVDNCLIKNGTAQIGGGIYMTGGVVTNCTVVANTGSCSNGKKSKSAGGLYYGGGKVVNSVFAQSVSANCTGAGKPEYYLADAAAAAENITYCAFDSHESTMTAVPNDTCFTYTPVWADANYRIGGSSELVNKGTTAGIPEDAVDLDGNPRIFNGGIDIGCYENQDISFAIDCSCEPTETMQGGEVTFDATTANVPEGATITYDWTITTPELANPIKLTTATPSFTFETPGWYTVQVKGTLDQEHGGTSSESPLKENLLHIGAKTNYLAMTAANSSVPFNSWERAATNIADVVREAVDGSTVLVAAGTYKLADAKLMSVGLGKAVTMIGVEGADNTKFVGRDISSGTDDNPVFILNNAGAKIAGLTLTKGQARGGSKGAGARVIKGTVEDCVLFDNTQTASNSDGGGLSLLSSESVARRCVIRASTCTLRGAGVYMDAGLLESCLVVSNESEYAGGGIYMAGGRVLNCTVVGNKADSASVGGIQLGGGVVTNTIVVGNTASTAGGASAPDFGGTLSKFVRCGTALPTAAPNATCLAVPADKVGFVDADALNYRLNLRASGFYKKGIVAPWMADATDLDGNPRQTTPNRVDLGCYESAWVPLSFSFILR